MADLKLVLPGPDAITLSSHAVDKLIGCGDGNAALLYLYALRAGGSVTLSQAARELGLSEDELSASMSLLKRLGLIAHEDVPAAHPNEETPEYTAEDVRRVRESDPVFRALVQEVQKALGKILLTDDLSRLLGMYHSLGLPPEVILHLVAYCISEHQRRYGPGRLPTMRYIEKTAFAWEREGICSLERAEQHIKALEARRERIAEIKKILQIKDRDLTSSEQKYVEGWLSLGIPLDVIELAYDRTVLMTGKLAWKYMDSIISSWHQKGLRTVAEIRAKDSKPQAYAKKAPSKPAGSAESDLADFERMKKFLEKLREE